MLDINKNENKEQTNSSKKFNSYYKYMFVLAFLFFVSLVLGYFIDYSKLASVFFDTTLILFIISIILTILANMVYTSPLIYQLIRNKSLNKDDLEKIVNEQRKPTKMSYKVRRILIWVFSFNALGILIAFNIYLMVLATIS